MHTLETSNSTEPPSDHAVATKKRLLVVDDHPIFRLGLVRLLENEPDLSVCGEVANAAEALSFLRRETCDAVLMDISLPGANGIELLKQIRAEHPKLPVLIVSMHDESVYALRALRSGALGYVTKSAGVDAVLEGLRKILDGQISVSPNFGEQLIYRVARGQGDGTG